jgi:hypothetical protein
MSAATGDIPEGFGPILRSSPVLEALGGFMSRGPTTLMPGAACMAG